MTQSSYLMSFVRSLMQHSSKDVRETKKQQLEAEFTQTGTVLNSCLSEKFEDVTKILTIYNSVSERINKNASVLGKVKRDLIDCKSLLNCNREELRRLWLEFVERRRCIELVDNLDRLQSAPDAISTLVNAHAWPEATELTIYASELLKSEIAVVPALQGVKTELMHKFKHISDQLKNQLYSLLYDKPFAIVREKYSKLSKRKSANIPLGQQDGDEVESEARSTFGVSHFAALPLATWHCVSVAAPRANPNLQKDPHTVAQSIAATLQSATVDTVNKPKTDTHTPDDAEWIRELIAVVHCLARLERLADILMSWSPQSQLSRMQQSISSSDRNVFSGPLIPGQGLLGEMHRFIVVKATNTVESTAISQGYTQMLADLPDSQYLVMLLKMVFDALFMHARACMLVIRTMQSAQSFSFSLARDLDGLTNDYIWSCVQQEIQLLLSAHLNKRSSTDTTDHLTVTSTEDSRLPNAVSGSVGARNLDLTSLLGRKRGTAFGFASAAAVTSGLTMGLKMKSDSNSNNPTGSGGAAGAAAGGVGDAKSSGNELFSFANTIHYLSVSSYVRESRDLTDTDFVATHPVSTPGDAVYALVCQSSPDNILKIYKPLMKFVEAVDREMVIADSISDEPLAPGGLLRHLPHLRLYLMNFIENTYLPETLTVLRQKVQQNLSSPDSLNTIVSQQFERQLGVHRPILSMVVTVDKCLTELKQMFLAFPEYAEGCLNIGTTLLNEFVSAMWRVYRGLSEVDSSGTTAPSSDWSQDDDVSRFWKKFPVWQRMAAQEANMLASNVLLLDTQNDNLIGSDKSRNKGGGGSLNHAHASAEPHIATAAVVALGLYNDYDGTAPVESLYNTRLMIPFVSGQRASPTEGGTAENPNVEYSQLSGLLYEREATRLAAKETNKLFDMIKNELPDEATHPNTARQLPVLRNMQLFKILGRLCESLCWLSYRILHLDTWLQKHSTMASSRGDRQRSSNLTPQTALSECSKELNRLSEACLLMIYLEVRIQAYNHFAGLPKDATYSCALDDVDVDRYVTDFLMYLEQVQDMLVRAIGRHKFRFIFDGLGDFIAQLLLRMIPIIPRMNANGNRKMCRNVYRLQQALTSLTESRETDLIRVKQVFELFNLTPEAVVDRLMEQGVAFDVKVYQDLMLLYQRSHSTYDYAKTQECITKLGNIINRPCS